MRALTHVYTCTYVRVHTLYIYSAQYTIVNTKFCNLSDVYESNVNTWYPPDPRIIPKKVNLTKIIDINARARMRIRTF